ncbi:hypothetical protein ACS386_08745 [Flavobacteriaceae bacterium LMO-SS05]
MNRMYSRYLYYLSLTLIVLSYSCVSVPYLDQHRYKGPVEHLTETTYSIHNGQPALLSMSAYEFTKNGRVKFAQTFDAHNQMRVTKEKKLWFVKQSFPDREPYYCKTRWKTHNRERISCYTQKQYKQNQFIYYYHDDGSIAKIEEDYSNFQTQYYHYNTNQDLAAISIKDKNGVLIDSVLVTCKSKDRFNNCTALEKRYTVSDSLLVIERVLKY